MPTIDFHPASLDLDVWLKQPENRISVPDDAELARQLGLRPEPAGRSPSAWYADCPGKSHRLMVSSSANEFGCGYCRVKGSTADLETLARQRKEVRS